jgi:hypothetical protein
MTPILLAAFYVTVGTAALVAIGRFLGADVALLLLGGFVAYAAWDSIAGSRFLPRMWR